MGAIWSRLPQDVQHDLFEGAVASQGESMRQQIAVFLHEKHSRTSDSAKSRAMPEPDSLGGWLALALELCRRWRLCCRATQLTIKSCNPDGGRTEQRLRYWRQKLRSSRTAPGPTGSHSFRTVESYLVV